MHAILNSEHLKINRFELKCEICTFMSIWVKSIDYAKENIFKLEMLFSNYTCIFIENVTL